MQNFDNSDFSYQGSDNSNFSDSPKILICRFQELEKPELPENRNYQRIGKIRNPLEKIGIRMILNNGLGSINGASLGQMKEAAFLVRNFYVFLYGHAPSWSIVVSRKAG